MIPWHPPFYEIIFFKIDFLFVYFRFYDTIREKAKEMEREFAFVHDLSHIFDDVDVYKDVCHVYGEGNKIIADTIWSIIKDKIPR